MKIPRAQLAATLWTLAGLVLLLDAGLLLTLRERRQAQLIDRQSGIDPALIRQIEDTCQDGGVPSFIGEQARALQARGQKSSPDELARTTLSLVQWADQSGDVAHGRAHCRAAAKLAVRAVPPARQ